MPAKVSRRLVIDASVARAAGGTGATFPTSSHCRDFLEAVRAMSHRVVMTPEVYAEWKEHQSRLAFIWQRTMVAKKRIVFLNISPHVELRNQVANTPADSKNREAMIKDIHLIEAALATDRTVISLDDTARKLFSTASVVVRELRRVVWVNPAKTSEEAVSWVKNGAKPERQRQLSFRIEEKQ